ncbi:MAG: hypothetical protein KKA07_15520 [Bacteroidetes bacterium]|nr:hypothetical protein [Bacteroidota bacterium]MBU1720472.1 hypothetical protein [Bacteroidota bacterium]
MKIFRTIVLLAAVSALMASCTVTSKSMKEPTNHVEFVKGDFDFSGQVSGEATSTKILGIDWARLFKQELGETEAGGQLQIPIIGGLIARKVNLFAVYNIMKDNPGYDVVFYPQFETERFGFLFFYSKTKVKATCRLAKIK